MGRGLGRGLQGPFAGAFVAVEHIVARDLVLTGAHQGQFHLVLDVLDVYGAAARQAPGQGRDHLLGQFTDPVMDAGGGGGASPFHRQEGLGQGDHDLIGVEVGDLAVAADDLDAPGPVGGELGADQGAGRGARRLERGREGSAH